MLDRGPGIEEEELGRVTEPFYRLEASRNRSTGGGLEARLELPYGDHAEGF